MQQKCCKCSTCNTRTTISTIASDFERLIIIQFTTTTQFWSRENQTQERISSFVIPWTELYNEHQTLRTMLQDLTTDRMISTQCIQGAFVKHVHQQILAHNEGDDLCDERSIVSRLSQAAVSTSWPIFRVMTWPADHKRVTYAKHRRKYGRGAPDSQRQ